MEPTKHSLLQFFKYEHLPEHLRLTSAVFAKVASEMDETLPNGAEKTVCLRKLLEAKDCAVRSLIYKDPA
jgi:hypothetical protein